MELSPDEILRLPRDVAVPLLARMANELRALRQTNVSFAADQVQYEITVAELKRERDDIKRQLSTLLQKTEEKLAASVENVPTFGFVYADHKSQRSNSFTQELEQRLKRKEVELAHLRTKIDTYEKKNKGHKEVPSSQHENGPALITHGIERMQIELDDAVQSDAVDDQSIAGSSKKRRRRKKERREHQGKWQSAPQDGIREFLQLRPGHHRDPSWPTYQTLMPYTQGAEFVRPEVSRHESLFHIMAFLLIYRSLRKKIYSRSRRLLNIGGLSLVLGDDHDIASILLIEPGKRVNGSGKSETTKRAVKIQHHKELLVQSNTQLWHYWGQYKCISISHLSIKSKILQEKLSPHHIEHLYEQSTIKPCSITSKTKQKIITGYQGGTWKVRCLALQRVGFSVPLDRELRSFFSPSSLPPTIGIGTSRKRGVEDLDEGDDHGRAMETTSANKRRKSNGSDMSLSG